MNVKRARAAWLLAGCLFAAEARTQYTRRVRSSAWRGPRRPGVRGADPNGARRARPADTPGARVWRGCNREGGVGHLAPPSTWPGHHDSPARGCAAPPSTPYCCPLSHTRSLARSLARSRSRSPPWVGRAAENPKQFLIDELTKLKAARDGGAAPAGLFGPDDFEALFGIFDVARSGYITLNQYKQGPCAREAAPGSSGVHAFSLTHTFTRALVLSIAACLYPRVAVFLSPFLSPSLSLSLSRALSLSLCVCVRVCVCVCVCVPPARPLPPRAVGCSVSHATPVPLCASLCPTVGPLTEPRSCHARRGVHQMLRVQPWAL